MAENRVIRDGDVARFVAYVGGLGLSYDMTPEEYSYEDPVLICMDAVLSINRRYQRFVVPRVKRFGADYPHIRSLAELDGMLVQKGYDAFGEVWNYRDPGRARLLHDLIRWFMLLLDGRGAENELRAMRRWASSFDALAGKPLTIRGIGFVTTQYLRMLLGASTVKPDRHIHRAVSDALGRNVSDVEAVVIVERAAQILGVNALALNHALWRRSSQD